MIFFLSAKKLKQNRLRHFLSVTGIAITTIILTLMLYFIYIYNIFVHENSSKPVIYNNDSYAIKTITVSNKFFSYSDSFFNDILSQPHVSGIRVSYEYISSFDKGVVFSFNSTKWKAYTLKGINTRSEYRSFIQEYVDAIGDDNCILWGRNFTASEKNAMLLSDYDLSYFGWKAEDIVDKTVTISTESIDALDVTIVGVYNHRVSEINSTRELEQSAVYTPENNRYYNPDFIFTSDIINYFSNSGSVISHSSPSAVDISVDNINQMESFLMYLRNEYIVDAYATGEQLIGIQMLVMQYGRLLKVILGVALIVVSLMIVSVIYRNIEEQQTSFNIYHSIGMHTSEIIKLGVSETFLLGLKGVFWGGILGLAFSTTIGPALFFGKPEFQTIKSIMLPLRYLLISCIGTLLLNLIIGTFIAIIKIRKAEWYE